MKLRKKGFGMKLLPSAIAIFGMSVLISIFFMIIAFPGWSKNIDLNVFWILCGIGSFFLMLILVFFLRYIFIPIGKLEVALKTLNEKNNSTHLDLNVNVNYISDSINEILKELKLSTEREHSEIILRQQSDYAQLQSQINPHFLYNTLESIRGQAIIDDNYKIADMTEALAKFFRYNIGKDNYEVTLGEELSNIKNYIYIQQYRFQDKFEFHIFNHDTSGNALNCIIPKMTLQPIVENSIYHGMENKIEKGNISVHIETTQDRLIILVSDDGGGMDKKTLEKLNAKLKSSDGLIDIGEENVGHNGIAMENVNNRLRLLYGESYGLKVSSTLDFGTEVELTIPAVYKDAE